MGRKKSLTVEQIEELKDDYVLLRETQEAQQCVAVLIKKYECCEFTIRQHLSRANILKRYKESVKREAESNIQVKLNDLAFRIYKAKVQFAKINIGDSVNLSYKASPKRDKAYAGDIRILSGEVFQKTEHLIYIRDKVKKYLKLAISASEIETGHIRIEVAI